MASKGTRQRYQKILQAVARNPNILNKALADELGCSESSISRDIAELRELGWLRLAVNLCEVSTLRERIHLSIKARPDVESEEWGYSGRGEFATFLANCLSHPEFQQFKTTAFIEAVDSVTGPDADIAVSVLADTATTWRAFADKVERLPGVTATTTRVVFRLPL